MLILLLLFGALVYLRCAATNEWLYLFALRQEKKRTQTHAIAAAAEAAVAPKAFYQIIFLFIQDGLIQPLSSSSSLHPLRPPRSLAASIFRFSLFVSVCIVQKNFRCASRKTRAFLPCVVVVTAAAAVTAAMSCSITFVIMFFRRNESFKRNQTKEELPTAAIATNCER